MFVIDIREKEKQELDTTRPEGGVIREEGEKERREDQRGEGGEEGGLGPALATRSWEGIGELLPRSEWQDLVDIC